MIDVTEQINAVSRGVGTRVVPAGQLRTVVISQSYRADVADVWDACTSPERIARWFLPVSGDLRPGGRYQLEGNAGGTIEHCDPPSGFSATWEYGDQVSRIEVAVRAEADGRTRLEITHIVPGDDEHWQQFGPAAVGIGWDMGLMGLAMHLTSGRAADRAEAVAWAASAEGRKFMTLSSERWRDASIAAGTDLAAADAAAERVTAAYTGAAP